MAYVDELRSLLENAPKPVCAELTPFDLVEASREAGRVVVRFPPQPAFGNHFGKVQGGFLVAMLDVPLSLAVFVATQRWLPTIEIKTSFVSVAPIAVLVAEATVLRAGSQLVFVEARISTSEGKLCAHATATSLAAQRAP